MVSFSFEEEILEFWLIVIHYLPTWKYLFFAWRLFLQRDPEKKFYVGYFWGEKMVKRDSV